MSALTDQVAREHLLTSTSGCTCGDRLPLGRSYPEHVALVTEQAVRANVAAEIDSVGRHWSGAPALAFFALTTDIREGRRP